MTDWLLTVLGAAAGLTLLVALVVVLVGAVLLKSLVGVMSEKDKWFHGRL